MEDTKLILGKLDEIKSELDYIKDRITDIDTVMTQDDLESLEEAEKEFKEGKTTSLSKLKEELGL